HRRDRWMAAAVPLALSAGFVAGYARFLDLPRGWADEPWKMAILIAALSGLLLAVAVRELLEKGLSRGIGEGLLALVVAAATWLTVRRFDLRWEYAGM